MSLTKKILIIWTFISLNQPGADKLAEAEEINKHISMELINNIRRLATYWMIRANMILQIGGYGQDIETDTISFRSKAAAKDGKIMKMWAHFISVVRRDSSLFFYWGRLETRFSESKKGGGGKLGIEELEHPMLY